MMPRRSDSKTDIERFNRRLRYRGLALHAVRERIEVESERALQLRAKVLS